MKHYVKVAVIMLYAVMLSGCQKMTKLSSAERQEAPTQTNNKILIDASRDGGVWWFPQSSETGFSSNADHQGKPLADYFRSQGYEVNELTRGTVITARGTVITDGMLSQYDKV